MKKYLFLVAGFLFFGVHAMAQVAPIPAIPEVPLLGQWLMSLAQAHPWLGSVLVAVGGLRLVLKPLFAAAHVFFQGAGLVSWDQKELAVEQSAPLKVLFFILDYFGSIKVPVAELPAAAPAPEAPKVA